MSQETLIIPGYLGSGPSHWQSWMERHLAGARLVEQIDCLANRWHADLINIGAAGHINAESGFGPWPQGLELLRELQSVRRRPGAWQAGSQRLFFRDGLAC